MNGKVGNLFADMPEKKNKNSYDFDCYILNKLKGLKNIPAEKFNGKIKQIMREKSSCQLWLTNNPSKEWDYTRREYRQVNFRCCPSSRNARNYFCLILDRNSQENTVSVIDGFLTSI